MLKTENRRLDGRLFSILKNAFVQALQEYLMSEIKSGKSAISKHYKCLIR
jgi:hypothetical protein